MMTKPTPVTDLPFIEEKPTPGHLPELEPLPSFPTEALGPILGNAAKAIADGVQAPSVIAAQSVLSVAALTAQQKANIFIDGRKMPLSLFFLSIAESGDRKTACDNNAMTSVQEWHREAQIKCGTSEEDYKIKLEGYLEEVRRTKRDTKEKAPGIAAAIGALERPEPPIRPDIICQEPTLEGLQKSLYEGRPSQGLFNDEGGQFFGGHAMNPENSTKSIAGLSKFWDGAPIIRTRAAEGQNFTLYNRRVSIHLMAQPIITAKILTNPLYRQQGILARFLIAEAKSLAGTRIYQPVDLDQQPALQTYHKRINALIDEPLITLSDGGLNLQRMTCTAGAKELWELFYNEVEQNQAEGGALEIIRPTASKMAENVARLAGVISVIEGNDSVESSIMEGAIILGDYYLKHALRIAQKSETTKTEGFDLDLMEWLERRGGVTSIESIQKCSPRGLGLRRSVKVARACLEELVNRRLIEATAYDKHGNPSEWRVLKCLS